VDAALAPIGQLTRSFLPFALAIAVALGLGGIVLSRRVVRPIERLTETADGLPVGGARFEIEATGSTEVRRLALALNRMVTAIEERDAALRQRAAELERLVHQLEVASRSKDEFLATVSHELRTPLNAVYGWARMLQGPLDDRARVRAIDAIIRNSNAQVQLIDDLLDVARIVTGKMRLDVRAVDLVPVVEAAIESVRPAFDSKGLRLDSVLDTGAGRVIGDSGRLHQVVWNLLMNSVKFTPRGGAVEVRLQRVDSHVELTVSDSGEGIAAHLLPVIFDRFQQADSTSTRVHGGLGLGLALVRHLVELHGGTVAAHSPGPGQGATFVVKLPVSRARSDEHPTDRAYRQADVPLPPSMAPALEGVRVLVVDDDPDSLALAAAILSGARADLKTASSAREALRVLGEWPAHVLVADIEMPGEDGYSLIRKVRRLDPTRGGRVPAVAVTAYGRAEDRVRTLSAGFSMHVPKPIDPSELVTVVATLARLAAPEPGATPSLSVE
jgi:signal transduction histidine kinase/CheY-like chemotaxis protein